MRHFVPVIAVTQKTTQNMTQNKVRVLLPPQIALEVVIDPNAKVDRLVVLLDDKKQPTNRYRLVMAPSSIVEVERAKEGVNVVKAILVRETNDPLAADPVSRIPTP